VVADAVAFEPVSTLKFPANREKEQGISSNPRTWCNFEGRHASNFKRLRRNSLYNRTGNYFEGTGNSGSGTGNFPGQIPKSSPDPKKTEKKIVQNSARLEAM
jgi:hypothetical protein